MFCLVQLASIAGGILCVSQSRKWFALWKQALGDYARPFPRHYEALISYGWLLLAIPLACVLLIPRHREDDCCVSEEWNHRSRFAALLGAIVAPVMALVGFHAIMTMKTN
jgi:hypothetical protein